MRRITTTLTALLLPALLLLPGATTALAQDDVPNILVWTGTYGFRHPSILDAQRTLLEMSQAGGFDVTITENPRDLNAARLAEFDILMWVSTTGKPPLSDQQQADVVRFAGCGGGTIGFHAALDSNYGWAEHAELFGAQFDSHPQGAGAGAPNMQVEDRESPITEGWHDVESFPFDDEYYRWRTAKAVDGVSLPRDLEGVNVLLSLDETSVAEGIQDGPLAYEDDQPIAWTKTFRDAGRVYYNNMGHSSETWSLPEFRTALANGVAHVAEVPLDLACFESDEPLPPPAAPPAPDLALVGEACTLPELQERSGGFTWEVSGPARALTPEGDEVALAAGTAGNLSWGGQTYIVDLSESRAAVGEVTLTLQIPVPSDDYDLSVSTAWGWYGSDQAPGVTSEQLVIPDVPHCSYLHVAGDNMLATSRRGPTLVAAVEPGPPVEVPVPVVADVLRITAASDAPADLALGWSAITDASTCGCALLARDDDFADALASGAAQADGRPLLLTDGLVLDDRVGAELERLAITRVTIIGGPAAVSEDVADTLAERGIAVDRIFGETRIETAIALTRGVDDGADAGSPTGRQADGAPLLLRAYGTDTAGFADALAAGRHAASSGRPILLTDSAGLSPAVADHLEESGATAVTVIGGEAAVGPQVVADLEAMGVTVQRVGGATRDETAVAIATELGGSADAVAAGGVVLLDGAAPTGWAEGFAAAGSRVLGPIVLVDGDVVPAATQAWIGSVADGDAVPLTCGALVATGACDAVAALLTPAES